MADVFSLQEFAEERFREAGQMVRAALRGSGPSGLCPSEVLPPQLQLPSLATKRTFFCLLFVKI